MDNRIELSKHERLGFPGMECVIDNFVGRGSNVLVYTGHYQDHHIPDLSHCVLVRELFPYDPEDGIRRNANGSIYVDPGSQALFDLNRKTFLRGNAVHLHLMENIPADIDTNINTFDYNHTLYSLVGYTGGRSLDEEIERWKRKRINGAGPEGLLHIVRVLKGALNVLKAFHEAGYLHLDISPDNILLMGEGEKERVTLIDYNSVHTVEELRGKRSFYYSAKKGYTAPEVKTGNGARIGEWSDLYSMTAVLYKCLTGNRLTPLQMVMAPAPVPGPDEAPVLKGCPETAASMVYQILQRGLAATPRRRYRSTEDMLTDLRELEDRILGKGITHWALWEKGRAHLLRLLKENTALDYICDEKRIYPLYAEAANGTRVGLMDRKWLSDGANEEEAADEANTAAIKEEVKTENNGTENEKRSGRLPVLLLGGGGMGKTTALFRIAYEQDSRYTPQSTAIYYVSLYGYRGGEHNYVCNRLLESLKFKEHTENEEGARRELMQLLDKPFANGVTAGLHVGQKEKEGQPPFLLLLDGLNEASGDTGPLLEEIQRLAALRGVQAILTSRSDPGNGMFRKLTLCRLEQNQVKKALSEEGILPPENMEVLDLLSFPMMLSIYIRTVKDAERQLRVESREELLGDYFDAILEKEKRDLPEETGSYIGTCAAVRYLLPEIASLCAERQDSLSDSDLLPHVEKWYKELSKKAITAVYPEWIGHTADLRLGAKTADEWYGKAVLEILWKRLGLLVRDEHGRFRIMHQVIEEYLVGQSRKFHETFDREKRRQTRWKLVILMILITCFAIYNMYMVIRLNDQNKQILLNDSNNQITLSQNALKDGNRYKAIEYSLKALPSESEDRPLLNAAQCALAEGLCAYETQHYEVRNGIEFPVSIQVESVSEDGCYLVVRDEDENIRCYNGITGTEMWSRKVDTYPSGHSHVLEVLAESNVILWYTEYQLRIYSISNGNLLWKTDPDSYCYNYKLIDDEAMVIAIGKRRNSESNNDLYEFVWVNLRDGSVLHRGKKFEYMTSGHAFDHAGLFLMGERPTFVDVEVSWEKEAIFINWIDMETGELIRREKTPVTGDVEYDDGKIVSLALSYDSIGNGIFMCLYSKDDENKPVCEIAYYSESEETWKFNKKYDCTSKTDPSEITPYIMTLAGGMFVVVDRNELFKFDSEGKLVDREKLSGTVYCRHQESPFELFLLFEDGTARYVSEGNDRFVQITDKMIQRASGMGKSFFHSLGDDRNLIPDKTKGPEDINSSFCFAEKGWGNSIIIMSQFCDRNGQTINEQGLHNFDVIDSTGNSIYLLPDTERMLLLYPVSLINDDYGILMQGTIYELGTMKEEARFSFEVPYTSTDLTAVTKDGMILIFQDCAYDINTHKLLELDDQDQAAEFYARKDIYRFSYQYVIEKNVAKNGINNSWFEYQDNLKNWAQNSIDWVFDGKVYNVSLIYGNENILDHRAIYNSLLEGNEDRLSKADFITGNNGLMVIRCSDQKTIDGEYSNSTYFMLYTLEDERWECVTYPFETGIRSYEAPFIRPAEKHKWIAISGTDNAIWLYDALSQQYRKLTEDKINYEAIIHMEFINDDRYLMIWQDSCFSVVDTDQGKTVYYKNMYPNELSLSRKYYIDSTENQIYLFGKQGFVLDLDKWETAFEIPCMGCVTDKWIITQDKDLITRYPKYEINDLIMMGREYLNQGIFQ